MAAAVETIARADPDVLLLAGVDWDADHMAAQALTARLAEAGADYPHIFAARPNAGAMTPLDLDGDGRTGTSRDAQGYGRFAGAGGLVVLSRHPLELEAAFTSLLWQDLPSTLMSDAEQVRTGSVQRLSSHAHWVVRVEAPGGHFAIWAYKATPPVFDGPEDRNGRRNHDETALWLHYLDGTLGARDPDLPFVILGFANADPADGEARREALLALLAHPDVQDPEPASAHAEEVSAQDGGVNAAHAGDPALDTVNWRDGPGQAGNLRVDYVLPSRHWRIEGAGVAWPEVSGEAMPQTSRHGLVWVDVRLQR